MVRSSMLEVIRQDYIRTARSKGLAEKVVINQHALKNALIPIITLLGLRVGWIMGGSVILELVFSRPGLGRLMIDAILARDYPIVQGSMLVLTSCIILANILADILYAVVDPRIKYR
jgi:peptide/nickel transport system permease protein